jgi:hypothetical protein
METSVSDGFIAKSAEHDRMLNWFTEQLPRLTPAPAREATASEGTTDHKPVDPLADPLKVF